MSGEAGGKRQGDVFRPGDVDLVGAGQAGGLWLPWEAVIDTGFGTCLFPGLPPTIWSPVLW